MIFSDEKIEQFNSLLMHRLYQPATYSTSIVRLELAVTTTREDHFGYYVGYFFICQGHTYFILYARHNEAGSCACVYLITVNNPLDVYPVDAQVEAARFMTNNAGRPRNYAIINVTHKEHSYYNLAAFLEVIPRVICPALRYKIKLRRDIRLKSVPIRAYEGIKMSLSADDLLNKRIQLFNRAGLKVVSCEEGHVPDELPSDWNLLIIKGFEHYYYALNNTEAGTINLILPHEFQVDVEQVELLRAQLSSHLRDPMQPLSLTRMQLNGGSCRDSTALDGLMQCIDLLPCSLFWLRLTDVMSYRRPGAWRVGYFSVGYQPPDDDTPTQRVRELRSISPQADWSQVSSSASQSGRSLANSSQATILYSQSGLAQSIDHDACEPSQHLVSRQESPFLFEDGDLNADPVFTQSQEQVRAGVADITSSLNQLTSELPKVNLIAVDDPLGDALKRKDIFGMLLPTVLAEWDKHVKLVRVPLSSMKNWRDDKVPLRLSGCDLEICPIIDEDTTVVLIFDVQKRQWHYLNTHPDPSRVEEQYQEITSLLVKSYPRLESSAHYVISSTNYFHKSYTRIHLLMALHTIGNLLKYTRMMPKKTVYTEKSFRLYCWAICSQLQLKNYQHNRAHNLIDINGELLEGAYVSYSSRVQFERSVVATHGCMICGARGFNNMGRHLSMAHGGQARLANLARQLSWK